MKNLIISSLFCIFIISSCTKDTNSTPEYNVNQQGKLSVEFDNIVGSNNLQLNTATYTNSSNQTFNVTKLKYFVSNFKFTNSVGAVYTQPQDSSYFLIDESKPNSSNLVFNLPEGQYNLVSFLVGVDSLRNTLDVSKRTGVLDVTGLASDMYWSWNSGYIFFNLEGTSSAITANNGLFQYHIGGFGGYNTVTPNNLKTIQLNLTARGAPIVKKSNINTPNIHLFVDVNKIFSAVNTISFNTTSIVHSSMLGIPLATNLAQIFTHDHTEN